jgi:hypothetical protein
MTDNVGDNYAHGEHDHIELQPVDAGHTHTIGSHSHRRVDPEARHHALVFFEKFKSICVEKGLNDKYHEDTIENRRLLSRLVFENHSPDEIPFISLQWLDGQNHVLIRMLDHIKQFSRRVNLQKNDKWTKIIEDSIEELRVQNLQYIATKTRLQNHIHKMGIEYSGFRKYGSTWQITCKGDDDKNTTIVQYDEKTDEYLFQRRYATQDLAFKLLELERRH